MASRPPSSAVAVRAAASFAPFAPLFPCQGMCYNRRAVERAVKAGAAPIPSGLGAVISEAGVSVRQDAGAAAANPEGASIAVHEDASSYCPVCSQRLESRRCKLICPVCGYYMSCADYY